MYNLRHFFCLDELTIYSKMISFRRQDKLEDARSMYGVAVQKLEERARTSNMNMQPAAQRAQANAHTHDAHKHANAAEHDTRGKREYIIN